MENVEGTEDEKEDVSLYRKTLAKRRDTGHLTI